MMISAAVCVALSVAFAAVAPYLADRLHPAVAVRLVVPAALAVTATSTFSLAACATTWFAQHPQLAWVGGWSVAKTRAADPVPAGVAIACAALLAVSTASLLVHVARRYRALRAIRSATAHTATDDVVLIDDARADAFATPGRHGRIVVTTAMMAALAPAERAALLAHERSHVRHRHAWWLLAAHAAASLNPLLRAASRSAERAIERWADEDAAIEVSDRRLVARAVARASLLKKHGAVAAAMFVTGGDVPLRVRALLQPSAPRSRGAGVALALFAVAALVALVMMERSSDAFFDAVQSA